MSDPLALLERPTAAVLAFPTRRSRWPLHVSALIGAAAGGWQAWVVHAGLADDAFIELATARNLATYGEWAVTPHLLSNTSTSPLWTALLAVPILVLPPVKALAALLTVLTGATSLLVTLTCRRLGWAWWAGPAAAAGVAASPVMQASVGLESALAVALLAALVFVAVEDRPVWAGVVCGLLALTRPELAVVGALVAVWWWRRAHLVVGAAVLTVLPWELVSLRLFGSLIPDTLIWKVSGQLLGGKYFYNAGALYYAHWPVATAITAATYALAVLVAPIAFRRHRGLALVLFGSAVAHCATLTMLGVGSFTWYYAPSSGAAILLVSLVVSSSLLPRSGPLAPALAATSGHPARFTRLENEVVARVRMPLRARLFASVHRPDQPTTHVLFVSHVLKVVGTHARRLATQVIQHVLRRPNERLVGNDVHPPQLAAGFETTVRVPDAGRVEVRRAAPEPAAGVGLGVDELPDAHRETLVPPLRNPHYASLVATRHGRFESPTRAATGETVYLLGALFAILLTACFVYTANHSWATQGNPWMANGALPAQYEQIAAQVPTGATVETTHGEVGSIAFYGGDRIRVVDPLSDPGRMAPYVSARLERSPWLRLAYPTWQPSPPVPAQWQTRYAPAGVPTWSGYGGWSHIAVDPVR